MSIFEKNILLRYFKTFLKAVVYKPGSTATILRGELKGYKYVVNDDSGWAPIYGGWEPYAERVYPRVIKKGDVVYDVGANTGITSLLFSKLVDRRGMVFAFEPVPANAEEIESGKALNNIKNITVIRKAVSDSAGITLFHLGKSNKSGSLMRIGKESGETIQVDTVTLDSLVRDGIPPPNFIKIDVEGAADKVLEGFSQSIRESLPTMVIELHIPDEDTGVGRFLKKEGYRIYRIKDDAAIRTNRQKRMVVYVKNTESGWPDPCGVWGTILAFHESRVMDEIIFG